MLVGVASEGGGDLPAEPLGHLGLGHLRPVVDAFGGNELYAVAVAAKGIRARRHVVGENPVAALAIELEARMLDPLFGLRRKAEAETQIGRAAVGERGGQTVWYTGEGVPI